MQRFLHDPVENLRSGGVRERCFHYVSRCFDEFAHRGPIVMSIGGDIRLPVGRVSIRFEVRGGSRRQLQRAALAAAMFQSVLRFAVVPDPSPLTRRSDKPCCGVLHTTLSRSSGWLPEPARNGVKPLVRCHTHLRSFLVVLQHPSFRVSPKRLVGVLTCLHGTASLRSLPVGGWVHAGRHGCAALNPENGPQRAIFRIECCATGEVRR